MLSSDAALDGAPTAQSHPSDMLAVEPLGRGPAIGQVQLQPVDYLRPLVKSLQAMHRWLPLTLELQVPREAKLQTEVGSY